MLETAVHDGFAVLEAPDHGATLRLLADVTRALGELYGPLTAEGQQRQAAGSGAGGGGGNGAPPLAAPPFAEWNEERRLAAKRRTVRDAWLSMLCELPGFGHGTAQRVVRAFPTPRALFDAFEAAIRAARAGGRDAVAAARAVLREQAGLSAAKAAQAYDDLYANGWHVAG